MAITLRRAQHEADPSLTTDELRLADEIEEEIDKVLADRFGEGDATSIGVAIPDPRTGAILKPPGASERLLEELRQRYIAAGWKHVEITEYEHNYNISLSEGS